MNDMLGKIVRSLATVKAEWLGALADLMEKLTSPHGESWFKNLKLFLRKEPCEWELGKPVISTTPTAWTVDDEGNIHFTLISNGFNRAQWENHFEDRGHMVCQIVRKVLSYPHSLVGKPTQGVTYNIVVNPGNKIMDFDRTPEKIRAVADEKGWLKPHWEVAFLIRDKFSDEQLKKMGLQYIVTMHEPFNGFCEYPILFICELFRKFGHVDGSHDTLYQSDDGGFAFEVPK